MRMKQREVAMRSYYDRRPARRYCHPCRRRVLAVALKCPLWVLGVHGLLTLVTCGLWLPVLLWAGFRTTFLCPHCGART